MTGSATILGLAGPTLGPDEAAFFRDADPWGFILFARNVEDPAQLTRLTTDLRLAVGRDCPVLVDQEGGRVQRLRSPHWREYLPPLDQVARAGAGVTRSLWIRARLIAEELRAVGIDANCAPTADIAGPATHPFLRNRCFGTDAATVIAHARTTAEGLLAGGVLPIVKHMPGHGRGTADSHHNLPLVDASADELFASDFSVFQALADLPLAMTSHVCYTAFDTAPATQSAVMVALMREKIGFDGLLMTDDLSMQALAGSLGERAALAMAAGCDIALHCNGKMPEMLEVVAAAGTLSPRATARAARALGCRHAPEPTDISALLAELDHLLRPHV
jgi:beta-N-acetylhexosaminidase